MDGSEGAHVMAHGAIIFEFLRRSEFVSVFYSLMISLKTQQVDQVMRHCEKVDAKKIQDALLETADIVVELRTNNDVNEASADQVFSRF